MPTTPPSPQRRRLTAAAPTANSSSSSSPPQLPPRGGSSPLPAKKPSSSVLSRSPKSTSTVSSFSSNNTTAATIGGTGSSSSAVFRIKTGCVVAWRMGKQPEHQQQQPQQQQQPKQQSDSPATLPNSSAAGNNNNTAAIAMAIGVVPWQLLISNKIPCTSNCSSCLEEDHSTTARGVEDPSTASTPTFAAAAAAAAATTTAAMNEQEEQITFWADPLATRDCHLALVGKRIRCSFPKTHSNNSKVAATTTTTNEPENSTNETSKSTKNGRLQKSSSSLAGGGSSGVSVLEGEVIRWFRKRRTGTDLRDYDDNDDDASSRQHRTLPSAFQVELLIDESVYTSFPHALIRTDPVDDESRSATTTAIVIQESVKLQRRRLLELQIRGKNKVAVLITLQHPSEAVFRQSNINALKWVIQKRVSAKLSTASLSSTRIPTMKRNAIASRENVGKGHDENHKFDIKVSTTPSKQNGCNNSVAMEQDDHCDSQFKTCTNGAGSAHAENGVEIRIQGGHETAIAPTRKKLKISVPNDRGKKANGATRKPPSKMMAATTMYIGDGNDLPEQQIANWWWLASRYHDEKLQSFLLTEGPFNTKNNSNNNISIGDVSNSMKLSILSEGFVGEVLKVDASASPGTTLAMVTLRRLFLPEHTATGRLSYHNSNHVFTDFDTVLSQHELLIQIPIEHLVIVGRKMHLGTIEKLFSVEADDVVCPCAYSFIQNRFPSHEEEKGKRSTTHSPAAPLHDLSTDSDPCHRCHRSEKHDCLTRCVSDECPLTLVHSKNPTWWCEACLVALSIETNANIDLKCIGDLPCCRGQCDCRACRSIVKNEVQDRFCSAIVNDAESVNGSSIDDNPLLFTASYIRSIGPIDFALPNDFVDYNALPLPKPRPISRIKLRTAKKVRRSLTSPKAQRSRSPTNRNSDRQVETINDLPENDLNQIETDEYSMKEDYSVFKPTCAREIAYDPVNKGKYRSQCTDVTALSSDRLRNIRESQDHSRNLITEKKDETTKASSSSRAARVSQRRLLKDVAFFAGAAAPNSVGLATFDTLSSREAQLRFDRSGIHAWGVFADAAISSGEMIVEYRGELIGNAVAERRENEYESAKIGSDYMFRIDAFNVCDATKQGNVARFINASCDPNCYTKIIFLDGVKRIVIYAKKDIGPGDELCYDYKFPVEYDESKRIPCHCGARDCRGFMNWDKRYVAVPHSADRGTMSGHKPRKRTLED